MKNYVKLSEKLFLIENVIKNNDESIQKPQSIPTNFIFVIDVSGSMSGDLSLIRKQLKNKLPNLVKEGDTVTIIWFSGRDQAGILKEEVEVKALTDLQSLNEAIDRYLKPICLTAFHRPLVLAKEAIERIKKNRPSTLFSLIFLTDGYNNDCPWNDVVTTLNSMGESLAASTFVEYGFYADTKRLNEMAELVGGEKVDAAHFDDYDVLFEAKLKKSYTSAKKILVKFSDVLFNFVFTFDENDGEIIMYSLNSDKETLIPENTKVVYHFSSNNKDATILLDDLVKRYVSAYVLSEKLMYDHVEDILSNMGEKYLYDLYSNAYGKQKLIDFKNKIKECVIDSDKRFLKGQVKSLVQDVNAYCVMNLIEDLIKNDKSLLFTFHDNFNYKRIGAKRVQKTGLTDEHKMAILEASSIDEIKTIVEHVENLEVVFEHHDKSKGVNISNLVWSTERANLSLNVRYDGYVKLPKNRFALDKIDTFIYRNYNIIKDGILNVTKLPVQISNYLFDKFNILGIVENVDENQIVTLNLQSLPIINKGMVKSISAKNLAKMEYDILVLKAKEKAYKYYENKLFPKVSTGFIEKYGEEVEVWLKELGITQYNGFAPKTETQKGGDFYMAVVLETKIAKHSSLPKVELVIDKINNNKPLTQVELLFKPVIDEYNSQTNQPIFKSITDESVKNKILYDWLEMSKKTINSERKLLLQEIAQIKFSLILSKKWFEEFSSFDDDTLTLKINNEDVVFKFEMTEKEIEV